MPNREEVLAWLKICGEDLDCSESCPYYYVNEPKGFIGCMGALMCDAKKVIEEQTQLTWGVVVEKSQLKKRLNEQPEQKHGHWISVPDKSPKTTTINMYSFIYHCSECGKAVGHHAEYNYCPGCGAQMDEGAKQDGEA